MANVNQSSPMKIEWSEEAETTVQGWSELLPLSRKKKKDTEG